MTKTKQTVTIIVDSDPMGIGDATLRDLDDYVANLAADVEKHFSVCAEVHTCNGANTSADDPEVQDYVEHVIATGQWTKWLG